MLPLDKPAATSEDSLEHRRPHHTHLWLIRGPPMANKLVIVSRHGQRLRVAHLLCKTLRKNLGRAGEPGKLTKCGMDHH
jgi:hypothetical protein